MGIKEKYDVISIPSKQTYPWLLKKHYAKRIPSISFAYGLYDGKVLKGICTFGQPPSDGLRNCCGEKYVENTIELNRLIKEDGLEKNLQSYFVSQCLKQLPTPMIVFSYSDPNYGHYGYTYQACNFYFTGYGGEPKEYIYNGHRYNSRHIKDYWFEGKNLEYNPDLTIDENFRNAGGKVVKVEQKCRYVYFVGSKTEKKDMKKRLKYPILPYPKGDNDYYDASNEFATQSLLFEGNT